MDLYVSPGMFKGVVLQLGGGEMSAPVRTSLDGEGYVGEIDEVRALSLSSGGGVCSEAVIVSGVPRGMESVDCRVVFRGTRRRRSRTRRAVVGLPCRHAGYATGVVLPGDVGDGVSGALPLTVFQRWGSPAQLRGMGRFGTTPA